MIEEMASCMCSSYKSEKGCKTCPTNWCYAEECATMAFCNNYRKIPEGSVVLQQKDLTKLQNAITQSCNSKFDVDVVNYLTNTVEALENKLKEVEEQRDRQAYIAEELIQEKHRWTEQARKETAKEILQALLDFVNCEKINQGHSFEKIKETLIKVAKAYEVEVEE